MIQRKKPNIFYDLTFVFFLQLMDPTKVCQNVGNVQVVYVELATNVHFAKMVKGNSHQNTFSQDKFRKLQGVSERFFKNGCGIQMSQATPTKFSLLFNHTFSKLF